MEILLVGLKGLRQARGLTQQQLAERAGISVATVAKHEQGVINGIDGETLDAIAAALNCSRQALFLPYNSDVSEIGVPA